MRVYVGKTRSRRHIRLCEQLGLGECCTRGNLPPIRRPWFFDNGAFGDHRQGRAFSWGAWYRDVRRIAYHVAAGELTPPDFVVMPDIVGGGAASLAASTAEFGWLHDEISIRYLVVQEGMGEEQVFDALRDFQGIFVGGAEMDWKLASAPTWASMAHGLGKRCHIGRIGNPRYLEWAAAIGADSVDSNWPLSTTDRLLAYGAAAQQLAGRATPP